MGSFEWMAFCSIFILLIFSLVACGDGDSAAKPEVDPEPQPSKDSEGNPLTAPVDYLGAVNQAQKTAGSKLSLVGIQQAIQQFKIMEDRLPRNLWEVVSSGYIARLPEAPRGSRIIYNPRTGVVSTVPAK